jgi:hypothetical protein
VYLKGDLTSFTSDSAASGPLCAPRLLASQFATLEGQAGWL